MAKSGPKGSPGAREPTLLSLILAWVPERGWPRDVWAASVLIPCTQDTAGGFRLMRCEHQHLPTQNKHWSHPEAMLSCSKMETGEERRINGGSLLLLIKGFKADFVPLGGGVRGMLVILISMVPSPHV